ncbi:MAG: DUF1365 domain-containing protein [Burkholderiales bacterium]|nr:DUF1365 domain-containing protein [Bacteroidia bacterium]
MHNRLAPKKHRFHYNVFMFYIDLDELSILKQKLKLFSHNRFNFFSFRDKEHIQLPINKPDSSKSTKEHITAYLKDNGIFLTDERIMILTNLNVLGYNFNPVSFYYIFNKNNEPVCSIAEVGNTFGELKPYLLTNKHLIENKYHLNTIKHFYVSPFFDLDHNFDFHLTIPDKKLTIRIDTVNKEERVFISTLTGTQKPLTNLNLVLYSIRFPLITLKIIILIHWNALLLWMKKINYYKKSEHQNLQKNVFRKYQN